MSAKVSGPNALSSYAERFQSLHTDQHEGRPRPHKAVMLLAVLSLADNGQLTENRIFYGPELLELFKRFFAVVRGATDQCTPWNPFFYMKREGFWRLHAHPGQEGALAGMGGPRGVGSLMANVAYASLDGELFGLIAQTACRETLRTAIIDRYFSAQRKALVGLCGEEREIGRVRENWREEQYQVGRGEADGAPEIVRSAAFARTVRQAYDYRCAACGLRFLYEGITIIDAAHLIPFSETRDDSPQNGISLCKNHHWLMDCHLMSPGPGRSGDYAQPIWHVKTGLNSRIEGQREVLALKNELVIVPADARLRPKKEALDRRMELLAEAC
ncbi:MAG: HNH endonuclease [Lentisphaerae bacterium]|nr:HNH endonuclease [Lentisphaerota bacterium]